MSKGSRQSKRYADLVKRGAAFVRADDGDAHGRGVLMEIELPGTGRFFEVEIKTCDREWGTLQEFVEALDIATKRILDPVEE